MKTFLFLIGLVVAGIAGYSVEPDLRFSLTGRMPEKRTAKPEIVAAPAGEPAAGAAPVTSVNIDLASLTPDQLPKKVVLKTSVDITDPALNLKVTMTAGSPVDLVRLEGQNAVVSPGSAKYQVTVPISQTDLMEQLIAPPPVEPEIAVTPAPEPEADLATAEPATASDPLSDTPADTEPATEPEPSVEPEIAAEPADEAGDPAVAAEPVAAVEPEPEPTPQPPPSAPVASGSVVAVMQSSIKSGEIKEFTFDQVSGWEAAPQPETIDGQTYQTGIASYKAETVFGVKTIQAKALIQGGKVVKWLWPKSGMEIK